MGWLWVVTGEAAACLGGKDEGSDVRQAWWSIDPGTNS